MSIDGWTWVEPTYGYGFDNVLASFYAVPVAANTSYFLPIGLYTGPVTININATQNAGKDPVIIGLNQIISGALGVGGGNSPNLMWANPGMTLAPGYPTTCILPRAACGLLYVNGATAGTLNFIVTAQQAA